MTQKISGTILAGGAASRLNGSLKQKIIVEGESIISRIVSVIKDIFDEIIIVTNNPAAFEDFNFCRIIQDEILNAGPLGGIHAAMKASSNKAIFVLAGDMPFLDKGIIIRMIEAYNYADCDALIPGIDEYIEPLHSIYSISLAEHLEAYLESDQSKAVRDYIKLINFRTLHLDRSETNKKAFTNINSPSDLYLSEDAGESNLP